MQRRRFLLLCTAGAAGCRPLEWVAPAPQVLAPGRAEGHALRDAAALPPPLEELRTGTLVLGSGTAGLSAAWTLARAGRRDLLLVDGPEPLGNAAAGHFGELGYPRGAHYLPLPPPEAVHVREMLADLAILEDDAHALRPRYDERALVHAPEERLHAHGRWHEGLVPPAASADEAAEQARFFAAMAALRERRGTDGRRLFCVPRALSSQDPAWTALDGQSFDHWLDAEGYRGHGLRWYLDYCCRDDYGSSSATVSAWAGLHYFASRGGQAANAGAGAVLTWPEGLGALLTRLRSRVDSLHGSPGWHRAGHALRLHTEAGGITALCLLDTPAGPRCVRIRARQAVCAMPLHVAARVVPELPALGFDPARHLPPQASWIVSSFLLDDLPPEGPGAPLAWDNVRFGGRGLGYVVSTHQDIRVGRTRATVFTAYQALSGYTPREARRWLEQAGPGQLLEEAACDLREVYDTRLWRHTRALEITLRGHAMAAPAVGFLANAGIRALREAPGPLYFAHADLSGFSIFEEASWWGVRAARRILDDT